MRIHEIPYVPQVEPARSSGDRSKSFEEELRKFMRGQVKSNGIIGTRKRSIWVGTTGANKSS